MGRFALTWAVLALLGAGPASLVYALVHRPAAPPWRLLEAEAAGRAQALDAHLQRWLDRAVTLSDEAATLLAQLPDGPIGSAAEGTLMLHLQGRLARDSELGELAVLSREGRVLLSTDGTRTGVRSATDPEVALSLIHI